MARTERRPVCGHPHASSVRDRKAAVLSSWFTPEELRVNVGMQLPELRADVVCDGRPKVINAHRLTCENA
jgi:hypothetical protein